MNNLALESKEILIVLNSLSFVFSKIYPTIVEAYRDDKENSKTHHNICLIQENNNLQQVQTLKNTFYKTYFIIFIAYPITK